MPILKRYETGAHKVIGLPNELVKLFKALPDVGDVLGRQTLAVQYMLPLEGLEVPYVFQKTTYHLFGRPTWRKLPNNPADKVEITAHLIFYWKDRSKQWSEQPQRRLTDTLARERVRAIHDLLSKGQ